MEHIIHLNSFSGRLSKDRKRVGRGIGSGKGGTSGAGDKGQSARSGTSSKRRHLEFARRFPKVGFRSHKPDMSTLTVHRLSELLYDKKIDSSKLISIADLKNAGISVENGLKIIGNTEGAENSIDNSIKIQANKITKGASECMAKLGASVEIVGMR